jgi:hypothetical protein
MARDMTFVAVGFLEVLLGGWILLPAVLRLRPRWGHDISLLFE